MAENEVSLTSKDLFRRRALCNVICGVGDSQKTGWFLGGHYDFGKEGRSSRGDLFVRCTTEGCCKGKRLQLAQDGGKSGGCIFTINGFQKHAGREKNKNSFISIKVLPKGVETPKNPSVILARWIESKATRRVPVGTKIDVLWPAMNKTYRGEVTGYDIDDLCHIFYADDDDFEYGVNLGIEMYRKVKPAAPAVPPDTPHSGSGMKSSQLLPEEDSSDEECDSEEQECAGPGGYIQQHYQGTEDLGRYEESDGESGDSESIPETEVLEIDDDDEEVDDNGVDQGGYRFNEDVPFLPFYKTEEGEEDGEGVEDEEISRQGALRKRPMSGPSYQGRPGFQYEDYEEDFNVDLEDMECDPEPARKHASPQSLPPVLQPRSSVPYSGVVLRGHHYYAELQIPSTHPPAPSQNSKGHHALNQDDPNYHNSLSGSLHLRPLPLLDDGTTNAVSTEFIIPLRSTSCKSELEAALAYDLLVLWRSAFSRQVAPDPELLNFPFTELEKQPGLVDGAQACSSPAEVKAYVDHLIKCGKLGKLVTSAPGGRGGGEGSAAAGVGQGHDEQAQDEEFDEEYERERPSPRVRGVQKRQREEGADLGEKGGDAKRRLSRMQAQRGIDAVDGASKEGGGSYKTARKPSCAPGPGRRRRQRRRQKNGYSGLHRCGPNKWRTQIGVVVGPPGEQLVPTLKGTRGAYQDMLTFPASSSRLEVAVCYDLGQLWKEEVTGVEYYRGQINCPAVWDGTVASEVMAALRGAKTITKAKEVFASPAVRAEVERLAATMLEIRESSESGTESENESESDRESDHSRSRSPSPAAAPAQRQTLRPVTASHRSNPEPMAYNGLRSVWHGKWRTQVLVLVAPRTGLVVPTSTGTPGASRAYVAFPTSSSKAKVAVYYDLGQWWKEQLTKIEYDRDLINCPAVWNGGVASEVMETLRAAKTITAAREVFASSAVRSEVLRLAGTLPKEAPVSDSDSEHPPPPPPAAAAAAARHRVKPPRQSKAKRCGLHRVGDNQWRTQIQVTVSPSGRVVPSSKGVKGASQSFLTFPTFSSKREAAVYRDLGQLWKEQVTKIKYDRSVINCPAVWDGTVASDVTAALRGAKTIPEAKEVFDSAAMQSEVARLVATMPGEVEAPGCGGGPSGAANPLQQPQQQQQVHGGVAPAGVSSPAAPPPPTLDEMQVEMEKLLRDTPGLSLLDEDVFAFMAHFVCNAQTRSCHLRMLRKLAEEGKPHPMKVYVQNVNLHEKRSHPQ